MVDPEGSRVNRSRVVIRGLLSVFILFHLVIVLLVPVGENAISSTFQKVIEPYTHFFELTNRWAFFAPEPSPPVYIEWELVNAQGDGFKKGMFPEQKNPYAFRERQNRRVAAAEFVLPVESYVEKVMVPYLCEQNPGVDSVRLWRVAYTIPPMADVASGKRKIGDDQGSQRLLVAHSFCHSGET
jgi:hypothetical protein